MKIHNARIKNVTVGFDDRDRLSARMTFEGQHGCFEWRFILTYNTDVQRLIKLMNYARVHAVENLNGKIIRTVIYDRIFCAFGDPIEDKFVLAFDEELKEITEAQLAEELLKT